MCQAYDAEWKAITMAEQHRAKVIGYGDCKSCGRAAREHSPYWPYSAIWYDMDKSKYMHCEGFEK